MFAAFLETGDENSQVIFGLQDHVDFQRSQLVDGSSALSGGGTNSNEGEPDKGKLDLRCIWRSYFPRIVSVPTNTIFSHSTCSGTNCWMGLSSRRRAWAVQASGESIGTDPVRLLDRVRDGGLRFLSGTCGANEGLTVVGRLSDVGRLRIFSYDGWQAAISVVQGGTPLCSQRVSSGVYYLG